MLLLVSNHFLRNVVADNIPTDRSPTVCQQSANKQPNVGRLSANNFDQNCRPIVGQMSANCCRIWADSRFSVGQQSTVSRLTVSGCELFFTITQIRYANLYEEALKWKEIYQLPFKVAIDSRSQAFQFTVLHGYLATNMFLHKIRFVTSPLCSFCKEENETLFNLCCL